MYQPPTLATRRRNNATVYTNEGNSKNIRGILRVRSFYCPYLTLDTQHHIIFSASGAS